MDLETGKKICFQLHPWLAKIFGKNRKMRFFGIIQILILGTLFDGSLPLLAWFLYGILNTRTKI